MLDDSHSPVYIKAPKEPLSPFPLSSYVKTLCHVQMQRDALYRVRRSLHIHEEHQRDVNFMVQRLR